MDLGLKGKVALVTGGASGIGAATVRLLAAEGALVVIADRDEGSARTLMATLASESSRFISADLMREDDGQRCIGETLAAFGSLDILINNAGVNDGVGLEQPPADFLGSLQRNLIHVFGLMHFALDALRRSRGGAGA